MFDITEIKHYFYCPLKWWYYQSDLIDIDNCSLTTNFKRFPSYKKDLFEKYLNQYGKIIYKGTVGKKLNADEFFLYGKPDYIIKRNNGYIPVIIHLGGKLNTSYLTHKMQITAACLLTDRNFGKVEYGLILYETGCDVKVNFIKYLRKLIEEIYVMRNFLEIDHTPMPWTSFAKCRCCYYREKCEHVEVRMSDKQKIIEMYQQDIHDRDSNDLWGDDDSWVDDKYVYFKIVKPINDVDSFSRDFIHDLRLISIISTYDFHKYIESLDIIINSKDLWEYIIHNTDEINEIGCALVYIIHRIHGHMFVTSDIAERYNIKKDRLKNTIFNVIKRLEIKLPRIDPIEYTEHITESLNASADVKERSIEAVKWAINEKLHVGRPIIGLVAACIYIASIICKNKISQKKIAEAADISRYTVRNRYIGIAQRLDKCIVDLKIR